MVFLDLALAFETVPLRDHLSDFWVCMFSVGNSSELSKWQRAISKNTVSVSQSQATVIGPTPTLYLFYMPISTINNVDPTYVRRERSKFKYLFVYSIFSTILLRSFKFCTISINLVLCAFWLTWSFSSLFSEIYRFVQTFARKTVSSAYLIRNCSL